MEDYQEKQEKLKNSWHKIMLLCGRQLIKTGASILAKLGEDKTQGDTYEAVVLAAYPEMAKSNGQAELHPEGDEAKLNDTSSKPDVETSLSSKGVVCNTANLINEYDRLAAETVEENFRALYDETATKLIENLILAGCTSINPQEDEPFDFNRHATRPFSFPTNKYVKNTLRLGVAFNDEVLIKAIVELK